MAVCGEAGELTSQGLHFGRPVEPKESTIVRPTAELLRVPNYGNGKAPWPAPLRWRIDYLSTREEENSWVFPPASEGAVLSLGGQQMTRLIDGMVGIGEGKGDCSIGNPGTPESRLWFWWWRGRDTKG